MRLWRNSKRTAIDPHTKKAGRLRMPHHFSLKGADAMIRQRGIAIFCFSIGSFFAYKTFGDAGLAHAVMIGSLFAGMGFLLLLLATPDDRGRAICVSLVPIVILGLMVLRAWRDGYWISGAGAVAALGLAVAWIFFQDRWVGRFWSPYVFLVGLVTTLAIVFYQ